MALTRCDFCSRPADHERLGLTAPSCWKVLTEIDTLQTQLRVLCDAATSFACIEVPEGVNDGTWVAKTTYCNNQITACQVRLLRRVLDATRRSLLAEMPGDAKALPEGADHRHSECPDCHYLAWRISAESGAVLYCEICDLRSQRRDALSEARRFKAERDKLRQQVADLRDVIQRLMKDDGLAHTTKPCVECGEQVGWDDSPDPPRCIDHDVDRILAATAPGVF